MIYKIQTQQLISSPSELAQRRLQSHQEKGTQSNMSIFEVANLMDQIFFNHDNKAQGNSHFEICFN